jgi:hypothetical protein
MIRIFIWYKSIFGYRDKEHPIVMRMTTARQRLSKNTFKQTHNNGCSIDYVVRDCYKSDKYYKWLDI